MAYCEIDKYASKAFSLIHNISESINLGDITKVKESSICDFDLMTWGFPCTDISVAGKQAGLINKDGNNTRSGLYYEGLRILKAKLPEYSIIENVKALTHKKFKGTLDSILKDLEELGYNSYWKVLNAKDFGVPQNRERIFIVSIRGDIDEGSFKFPTPFGTYKTLKDIIEEDVEEKYYIPQDKCESLISKFKNGKKGRMPNSKDVLISSALNSREHRASGWKEISGTLCARDYKDPKVVCVSNDIQQVGMLEIKGNEQVRRVYSTDGISPTLNTMAGGNRQPKIVAQRGRYSEGGIIEQQLEPRDDNATNTITTVQKDNLVVCEQRSDEGLRLFKEGTCGALRTTSACGDKRVIEGYSIRKLTPLECFRLMDFDDKDYQTLRDNKISNSQMYKMAGNSIVVKVLEEIFKNLFKNIVYDKI